MYNKCLFALISSDVQGVATVLFACVCVRDKRVLLLRKKLDSRGLAGVNWGVMWFVLLVLPAALASPLNQVPCDYSLMAPVTSVCFKQPATAEDKMIRLIRQWHCAKWIKNQTVRLQHHSSVLKRTVLQYWLCNTLCPSFFAYVLIQSTGCCRWRWWNNAGQSPNCCS